jgi:rhodanese-related sulfurtransferase
MKTKLCYCQSSKHARAAVKALQLAGYTASTDKTGYIYCDAYDTSVSSTPQAIVDAAIKGVK